MVYRIYVEKKPGFDGEAQGLCHELVDLLGSLTSVLTLPVSASSCSARASAPPCAAPASTCWRAI